MEKYLSKKVVKQFDFYLKHENDKRIGLLKRNPKKEDMYFVANDIVAAFRYFLATEELIDYVKKARRITNNSQGKHNTESHSLKAFLRNIKRLHWFFDFHDERGGPVQDQRLVLLRELHKATISIINHFQRRVKE